MTDYISPTSVACYYVTCTKMQGTYLLLVYAENWLSLVADTPGDELKVPLFICLFFFLSIMSASIRVETSVYLRNFWLGMVLSWAYLSISNKWTIPFTQWLNEYGLWTQVHNTWLLFLIYRLIWAKHLMVCSVFSHHSACLN
jgi:hypothetical protein